MPGAALVFGAGALAAVALPGTGSGFSGQDLAVAAVYVPVVLFCSWALVSATVTASGAGRKFWGLLGAGVLLYFAGSPLWSPFRAEGSWATTALYAASVALLFGALFLALRRFSRRVGYVAWLDALGVALSVGMLLSYFFLTPAELAGNTSGWREGLVAFSAPVASVGLLYLSLLLLGVDGSPAFSGPLALGFLALFVAEGAFLLTSSLAGTGEPRLWQQLLWISGPFLVALAARRSSPAAFEGSVLELGVGPGKQAAFWFGPLSPAVHFIVVLGWAASNPPVPGYLAAGGAAFALYCGMRFALYSRAVHRLRLQRDRAVGRLEQGRISEELHDTLKQNVYGAALLLETYRKVRQRPGAEEEAQRLLEQAVSTSREAAHQVGRSVEEMRARSTEGMDLIGLLRERLAETHEQHGIRTQEDLEADPALLDPDQRAAAYRIASEALWNVARHSGARNVRLQTRLVGFDFILTVRDDGRGLPTEDARPGLGIPLMRERARSARGELIIFSNSGGGTTVLARFDTRPDRDS
ncbi:Histidine kinase-, DNA gyrase B-, and HSP90-like ATPase [Rubrobacter radiotolerans]|uniref:Histidine kinase n=1 Tax=Rubrobacter radiotolerans TaxID=42256 RepID=A0A023X6C0_RUBRA|nr:ATP-binding protein [Rubrobacter radiotolerans]AHY47771.1 Histidine kinase-, DNA gyrase B-, and HSP90-like ATPase [Rubrobacter radiotolerans]MDX5892410.1 histidine kinase [Rubrobacter radiotolerans]SMC07701.1 Signal transduction histidine kinase [Rubrobacter radiotolerans DSM 5868]